MKIKRLIYNNQTFDFLYSLKIGSAFRAIKGLRTARVGKAGSLYVDGIGRLCKAKKRDASAKKSPSLQDIIPENVLKCPMYIACMEAIKSAKQQNRNLKKIVKKITERVKSVCYYTPEIKRVHFVTVTFPKGFNDEYCYEVWNTATSHMRKCGLMSEFLKVSERQKNGTLHFHIIWIGFCDIQRVNKMFAVTINNVAEKYSFGLGFRFIDRYNGVDIAKDRLTRKVVNFKDSGGLLALTSYITKYITKNNDIAQKGGWSCSRYFTNVCTSIRLTTAEMSEYLTDSYLKITKILECEYGRLAFYKGLLNGSLRSLFEAANSVIYQGIRGYTPILQC